MVGTLYNAIAVGVGASAGLWLGKKISKELQILVFQALGLFTLGLGFSMSLEMDEPFAVFLALVFGTIVGQKLQIDQRVHRMTDRLGEGTGSGLVQSVLLFCAGAMTLVGCMQDGLQNDPTILFIKGICATFGSRFNHYDATFENSRTVRFVDIKIAKSTLQHPRPKLQDFLRIRKYLRRRNL
mgnify:CR=1 FL=1